MKSQSIEARIAALEKATAQPDIKFVPQIVFYDLATGEPLTTPDPMAKQIWFGVTDKIEQERILRR